jgi:hypothetical protein
MYINYWLASKEKKLVSIHNLLLIERFLVWASSVVIIISTFFRQEESNEIKIGQNRFIYTHQSIHWTGKQPKMREIRLNILQNHRNFKQIYITLLFFVLVHINEIFISSMLPFLKSYNNKVHIGNDIEHKTFNVKITEHCSSISFVFVVKIEVCVWSSWKYKRN